MALLLKELRECSLYAGLALLVQIHYVGEGMKLPLVPFLSNGSFGEIPFMGDRDSTFTGVGIIAAIVLGLHQTVWESFRQTTLLLLHRPVPRHQIFLSKLLAGVLLLLGITVIPLSVYCLWAAVPGTHASPFFWGMTEPWWRGVAIVPVCYLGAFLTGLRPAHWLGSRTWPLITVLALSLGLKSATSLIPMAYVAIAVMSWLLVIGILETARQREYP